jgi:hypothetical protein
MRRSVLLGLALLLAGCAYEPDVKPPGAGTGAGSPLPPPSESATTPPVDTAIFTPEGCPVDDPPFCERASELANALVGADSDMVFDMSFRERFTCAGLDTEIFPQCEERDALNGYAIGSHQGEIVYLDARHYRGNLEFFVEAVDDEYTDDFGGPEMRVLGVSSCGSGQDRSYHVVYLVGLGDPNSEGFADRFLGTYELVERDGEWVIGITYVGQYTDWQLVMDDPLTEIACGDTQPWES